MAEIKEFARVDEVSSVNDATDILFKDGNNIGWESVSSLRKALVTSEISNQYLEIKDITNDYYNGTLKTEIAAGNFKNVHPGNYIIGKTTGTKWYVVHLDYWLYKGASSLNTHHLTIMPERLIGVTQILWAGLTYVGSSSRNTTQGHAPWAADSNVDPTSTSAVGKNDTSGGYANSFIKTEILPRVYNEWLVADFDSANVLQFSNLLGNATNSNASCNGYSAWTGATSNCGWVSSYCDLPSECQIYGHNQWSSSGYDCGAQENQFALFRLIPWEHIWKRGNFIWLQNVASSAYACLAYGVGLADCSNASGVLAVCPFACIR